MSDGDPTALRNAIDMAEDAFDLVGHGSPVYEEHICRDSAWQTQLQKACRLLDASRTLRANDGYYTSVIEMSFAAIERTLEFYCLYASGNEITYFQDHATVYDRIVALGLYTEDTAARMRLLYGDNRTGQYYGSEVSTRRQATAMFELASVVHEQTVNQTRQTRDCCCPELDGGRMG